MALSPYQPYQPLGFHDPAEELRQRLERQQSQERAERPLAIPPLAGAEQESLLSTIGSVGLWGLGKVGGFFDKMTGGRAIRGLLGGKPRELLSAIPLSDVVGLTDPGQRVSGADLLGLPADTSPLSWEGLGGIGLEMLLDPVATFGTFGPLTKGLGRAAQQAGVLPRTFSQRLAGLAPNTEEAIKLAAKTGLPESEVVGKPLAALFGLGLPFAKPLVTMGGPAEWQALSRVASRVAGMIPGSSLLYNRVLEPLGRHVASVFDPTVMGTTRADSQEIARRVWRRIGDAEVATKTEQLELLRVLQEHGLLTPQAHQELRQIVENTLAAPTTAQAQVAARMSQGVQEELAALQAMGLPVDQWVSQHGTGFFPRQRLPLSGETPLGVGGTEPGIGLRPEGPHQMGRAPALDIPGGSRAINEMIADLELKSLVGNPKDIDRAQRIVAGKGALPPELADIGAGNPFTARDTAASTIRRKYLGWTAADEAEYLAFQSGAKPKTNPAPRGIVPGAGDTATGIPSGWTGEPVLDPRWTKLEREFQQSQELVGQVIAADPRYSGYGLPAGTPTYPFFGIDPLRDYQTYRLGAQKSQAAARGLQEGIAGAAVHADAAGPGFISLDEALRRVGMARGQTPTLEAQQAIENLLAGRPIKNLLGEQLTYGQAMVDPAVIDDLTRIVKSLEPQLPATGGVLGLWDNLTNLNKTFQTVLWPMYFARNLISGAWQSAGGHAFSPSSVLAAGRARAGQALETAPELMAGLGRPGMSAERATQELLDTATAHGLIGRNQMWADNTGAGLAEALSGPVTLPGTPQEGVWKSYGRGLWDLLAGTPGTSRKPWEVAGVGGQTADTFALAKGGRAAQVATEETQRLSTFLELLRQGFTAEGAAKRVKELQYEYVLTPFERDYLRRIVPFYAWSRQNLPHMLSETFGNPSGLAGQSTRLAYDLRGQDPGFVPPWLGEGLVAKLGAPVAGQQQYLKSLGLPFEELGPALAGRGSLSMLNPLIKAPLELLTGQQLFSGRPLEQLTPTTGSVALDEVLSATPASRLLTTYKRVMDPRNDLLSKILSMTTGVEAPWVDVARSRDAALTDYVMRGLGSSPRVRSLEVPYVAPNELQNLTPQELLLLRLNATLGRERRERARLNPAR